MRIRNKSRFKLTTPLGVVDGQNSVFLSTFIFGQNQLDVILNEGEAIYVENEHGSVDITVPGYGTTIIGSSAPKPAEFWPKRKLERARTSLKP